MFSSPQPRVSLLSSCALLTVVMLATAGCSSRATRAQRSFQAGQRYLEQHKYSEAAIEFEKSLQRNPASVETRYQLALAYIDAVRFREAYRELDLIVQTNPGYVPARIAMAEVLLQVRENEKAREQAEAVQKIEPQNAHAQAILAKSYMAENDLPRAIAEWDKLKTLAPQAANVWTAAGVARVAAHQYPPAESDFRKAVELDPNSVDADRNLADLFQLTGRVPEAEKVIREGLSRQPKSLEFNLLLADFYYRQNRMTELDNLFSSMEQQLGEGQNLRGQIGDFWMWRDRLDRAVPEYEAQQAAHPGEWIDKKLITSYITLRRTADAARLNQKILAKDPHDLEARGFAGAVSYLQGDFTAATQQLQAVIKDEPNSVYAHYYLGLSWMALNNPGRAKDSFYECIRLDDTFPFPYLRLADLDLQRGDPSEAIEQLKKVFQLNPRSTDAYLLLGRAYIAKPDILSAKRILDVLQKLPNPPAEFYELSADAEALKNNDAAAGKYLTQALTSSKQPLATLSRYASFQARRGHAAAAIESIQQWIRTNPSSDAYDLLARLSVETRNWDAAEAAARRSLELNPQDVLPHMSLGQVFQARGNVSAALLEYDAAIKGSPRDVVAYLLAGDLSFNQGQYERAKSYYDAAKQHDPDSSNVNFALATWYAERGQNLDEALTIAQELKKETPADQNLSDTLGWIYYQKGFYSMALQQLEPAAAAVPDNPTFQYHLGMAYFQAGRQRDAKQALTRALKLGLNPSGPAAQAQQTLVRINNG